MKNIQQTTPEFTTDAEGQRLVHVALANSKRATLYEEDYELLIEAGFTPFWKFLQDRRGHTYPTLNAYSSHGHSQEVTVARLISRAGQNQCVRPADGNPLNLRRENLELLPGVARFGKDDWFPNKAALRAAGIEAILETMRHVPRRDPAKRPKAGTPSLEDSTSRVSMDSALGGIEMTQTPVFDGACG